MAFTDEELSQIRRVVREELDATGGLQEDADPPLENAMFQGADGQFNVNALLSDNQRRMRERGRSVYPSEMVFTIYSRAGDQVANGQATLAAIARKYPDQARRLQQFMLDNPERFGSDWTPLP